jgi:hypothetical protein
LYGIKERIIKYFCRPVATAPVYSSYVPLCNEPCKTLVPMCGEPVYPKPKLIYKPKCATVCENPCSPAPPSDPCLDTTSCTDDSSVFEPVCKTFTKKTKFFVPFTKTTKWEQECKPIKGTTVVSCVDPCQKPLLCNDKRSSMVRDACCDPCNRPTDPCQKVKDICCSSCTMGKPCVKRMDACCDPCARGEPCKQSCRGQCKTKNRKVTSRVTPAIRTDPR